MILIALCLVLATGSNVFQASLKLTMPASTSQVLDLQLEVPPYLVYFYGDEDQTQGFLYARQALYQLHLLSCVFKHKIE